MNLHWLEQSESDVPSGDGWLSGAELALLERLRIPKRRADWRVGRWTAKCAIAAYLQLSLNSEGLAVIEVRPAASGAPEAFIDGERGHVSISISHSHGVGFCVVAAAGADVGCDVERVAPHSDAFLCDYFTAEEQEFAGKIADRDRDMALTLLWSAKESTLKALRCGLRSDTRSVTVVASQVPLSRANEWLPLEVWSDSGRTFHGWWRKTGGFVWTLMANGSSLPPVAL